MDGSYGSPYSSPTSNHVPPDADQYKANVNRQKTRKWVEAKPQAYDGDDWGSGYDEPDANAPSPPPKASDVTATNANYSIFPPHESRPNVTVPSLAARESSPMPLQAGPHGPDAASNSISTGYPQSTSSESERLYSPAPLSTAMSDAAARYPLRKSSIGQQDSPGAFDNHHQPRTSSLTGDGTRARVPEDNRPSSRGDTTPPTSATKPLTFVRPADIYRRMELEKEKERRSMDSNHSRSDEPLPPQPPTHANAATEHPAIVPQTIDHNLDHPDDNLRDQPRQLSPVAERKSEYGFPDFVAPATAATQPSLPPHTATTSRGEEDPILSPSQRFSTSPTLPELGRLSVFGFDMFSPSGAASEEESAPPVPAIPLQRTKDSTDGPSGLSAGAVEAPHGGETVGTKTPAQPSLVPPQTSRPFRPSLPGGWVTETPTPASEIATPGFMHGDHGETLDVHGSRSISPVSEVEAVPRQSGPGHGAANSSGISVSAIESDEERPDHVPEEEFPETPKATLSRQHEIDPMSRAVAYHTEHDQSAHGVSHDTGSSSVPAMTPIPPLQPKRDSHPSEDNHRQTLTRADTMESSETPLKESDVLRHEIMKSLGPANSSRQVSDPIAPESSNASRGAARESAYLDDVYGDYLGAGDGKSELKSSNEDTTSKATRQPLNIRTPMPLGIASPAPSDFPTPDIPMRSPKRTSFNTDEIAKPQMPDRNRFSWEGESEAPRLAQDHDKSSPEPQTTSQINTSSPDTMSPIVPLMSGDRSNPTSGSISDHTVSDQRSDVKPSPLNHEVSEASTAQINSTTEAHESPSPVSEAADKRGKTPTGPRQESLAEDENPMRTSSDPEPPTLPERDHPAPSVETAASSVPAPALGSSDESSLYTTKHIMKLPSSHERTDGYTTARANLGTLDTGLNNWLRHLTSSQPEHASATPYYGQSYTGTDGNPSSSQGGVGQSMRPAASPLRPSNDYRPATGQVSAKGKEFLLAAGKGGRGLISKAKMKIREQQQQARGGPDQVT